ncbi:uridylate kinase [Methanocalculus chunghsingensis]|uniref:Uridylate kinase n=1 Tax=Methanocalculus chunghsingensis TaxID=156457 RepID=A0A8J8B4H9_9EURY|nr:uridylate kinase [Methanocalculus chunghsingensis]MBR1368049.1 uridylate kinase [Methanocalculus chunghsingensis]
MHRRREIESKLKGETLGRRGLLRRYEGREQLRIAPNVNVVKIGGHGIVDYGAPVLKPLASEIGALSRDHQMLIVTGGGVRVRHILDIGLDLGMPTGVLAELSGKVSEQNAIMMSVLLSEYGGARIHSPDLLELPMLLKMGILPVTHGTPPYGLFESPPDIGMIPPHRTDTGAFLIAEVLGAKSCILMKNVDGLFTSNPLTDPHAELIEEIRAYEILDMEMDDLVLEEKVVEMLPHAKAVREIQIINGHLPGMLTRALKGERIGTIIKA